MQSRVVVPDIDSMDVYVTLSTIGDKGLVLKRVKGALSREDLATTRAKGVGRVTTLEGLATTNVEETIYEHP